MNRKKQGWINTNNIYIYLLAKSLLAILLLLGAQVLFYFANTRIFHVDGWAEWSSILWGNIVFALVTVGLMLLPYYFVNLLPLKCRWNKTFRAVVELFLYYIPVLCLILADVCDAPYFQFTYRRLSGEIFHYMGIGGNMMVLWPHFLKDYWYATLVGLFLLFFAIYGGRKIVLAPRIKYANYRADNIFGSVLALICLGLFANALCNPKAPWPSCTNYSQCKNSPLVTNSLYNIIRTYRNGGTLNDPQYMSPDEAQRLFDPRFQHSDMLDTLQAGLWAPRGGCWSNPFDPMMPQTDITHRKNVVILVLESFGQEYMGCYNHGAMASCTPFLDSLSQHAIVYQGRANGKKSIEGIPAVFASLPTLMDFPYPLSDYADDSLYALPAVLRDNGYHTAFFHGGDNGVMSFDNLCRKFGFQEYYGRNEYEASPNTGADDYDGCWGIYDEPYLQYMVRQLSTFQEPFMSGVFTLSSHHPYTMAPNHKDDFAEGPHKLCRVISYTDNALRLFFKAASQTDWYTNTIFVITADHSGQGLSRPYNDYNGWYRIPLMFYIPQPADTLAAIPAPHHLYPRLMQQLDIMPTLLDYLGITTPTVCFGTSAFRNPDGWQLSFGNDYYQLETQDGNVAVIANGKQEGNGNHRLLRAILQQYSQRLINNQMTR